MDNASSKQWGHDCVVGSTFSSHLRGQWCRPLKQPLVRMWIVIYPMPGNLG